MTRKEMLEKIKKNANTYKLHDFITELPYEDYLWLVEQAEKQTTKEVIVVMPGGGVCPSCEVRLVGKANHCGKCGQKLGWRCYSND